ncbi:MAG: alpha/beta hydrolase fold domain-containing protein [Bacteroidales bacterium]|nr:alpha/beta hydrolase fold domain-containing protein [Bacteroidales bacterium]
MVRKFGLVITLLTAVLTAGGQEKYRLVTDVPYYEESERQRDAYLSERCKLDIYYPAKASGVATIVWFHGGGLTCGQKFFPQELKERGYCLVAVNYRLSPKAKCPAYIEDAAAAVAWVFRNIDKYGGSAERIFVAGHSAGAYLTGMLGLDRKWLQQRHVDADSIKALFILSATAITHYTIRNERGIPDTQPLIDEFALTYNIRPNTPPVFLMTGDRELEMAGRYEENAYLWRMMKVIGNKRTTLYEFDGYGHDMTAPAFPLMLKHIREINK